MDRTLIYIRYLFVAASLLVVLVLTSCSDREEDVLTSPEQGTRNVGLRISVDRISSTRGTPTGPYDDGRSTAYENYINVIGSDFKVLLFESTEPYKLAAEVSDVEITAVEADVPSSKTYILLGKVPSSLKDGSYKLMLLTNWKGFFRNYPSTVPGVTTIDDLTASTDNEFSYDYHSLPPFIPSAARGIPMYGIKDCENVVFRTDIAADLGKIHLLRAMAKIEVQTVDGGVSIESAAITRVNKNGLAAPCGIYTQGDYVKGSYKEDYLGGLHLPTSLEVAENVSMSPLSNGGYVLYVPEYDNTSSDAKENRSQIHLAFANGEATDLDFKYYDAKAALDAGKNVGDPFDIKRNYYYKYRVNLRTLAVEVDVVPYTGIWLDPDFGLDRK